MYTSELITVKENFLVVLDSRNGTRWNNGTWYSSVFFDFIDPIRVPKTAIQCTCSVLSFSCPNSLYIINETNSLLSVTLSGVLINYSIPYGNYNANTFINAMKTILDSGFSISINPITNKSFT